MSSATTQSAEILTPELGAGPAVLPPGDYQLAFKRYVLLPRFQRGVLELWFAVADYGPYFGSQIARYYNVKLTAKRRNFSAKPQSAFSKEYCRVFGRRPNPMGISVLRHFQPVLIIGAVGTVETDYEQRPLPEAAQYSVIRELKWTSS